MFILSPQMYEYDMELLLIMMDHNKINNSFKFKSNSGIKCHEFLMILQKCTNNTYCNLQYSIAYYTINTGNLIHDHLHHCHNNNNIKVYPNQLQQLLIPAKVR